VSRCAYAVPDTPDDLPGGGDPVPGYGNEVPSRCDKVPGRGDSMSHDGDHVPGDQHVLSGVGDEVPRDRHAVPDGGHPVSDLQGRSERWFRAESAGPGLPYCGCRVSQRRRLSGGGPVADVGVRIGHHRGVCMRGFWQARGRVKHSLRMAELAGAPIPAGVNARSHPRLVRT
jgi:hypothetical protein